METSISLLYEILEKTKYIYSFLKADDMELAITTIDEKAGLIEKYSAIGDSVSEEARVILKEIEQYDKQILREFNRVKTNIEAERNKNKRNLKDYTTTKKVLTKYAPYGGVVHNGSYIDKKK